MSNAVLYDVQGPKARRRTLIGSGVGAVLLVLLLAVAARRLADKGQFEPELYEAFFNEPQLWRRLGEGLQNTLTAAGFGLVLATAVGVVLAFGRLSPLRPLRLPAVAVIELFRATPLLLLIFAFFLATPIVLDIRIQPLWALVLGLTLYNGAVIAEIIRAGILSLPKGQTEAALAIGLTRGQTLRTVLLPQAVRIMLPSLISQLIVLLKDTSLGFIIGFEELLRVGGQLRQFLDNPIQMYVVIALIYIAINLLLGRIATYVESRQRHLAGGRAQDPRQVETGMGAAAGGTF